MDTQLMWFRRDLRVADHPALTAAAGADRLLCAFVLDDALLESSRMSAARLIYLRHALADLASTLTSLGNHLVIRLGDPVEEIPALVESSGAHTVHVSADHTPYATTRDRAVEDALAAVDVELVAHGGVAIAPPGSVRTGSGSVYKVFTPFHRAWRDRSHGNVLSVPDALPPPPDDGFAVDGGVISGVALTDVTALQVEGPDDPWPEGGESAARERLDAWLADGVAIYDDRRDVMAVDGTSRLSPDLHFGCLSAREVHERLDRRRPGEKVYGSELAWRDFYLHVMAEWPETATRAFRPEYADLPWSDDDEAFQAWCDGQTGYPVVDAAMRQLRTTGWMHNRARMIVASFLCKDLLIDWRRGEAHFLHHLIDGDVSSNNGGWQWAAGTGTDAQPFFRIFNPTTQGRRFDPDGEYVRRFVPELAGIPAPLIHEPWRLSEDAQREHGVVLGSDYPHPIVDHAEARDRALAWFAAHKG